MDTLQETNTATPTQSLPSKALHMDFETAMYRIEALCEGICSLSNDIFGQVQTTAEYITELARLAQAVAEDQRLYQEEETRREQRKQKREAAKKKEA